MQTIRGYGYYSTNRFRLKKAYSAKRSDNIYLVMLLWSVRPENGVWVLHSLIFSIMIALTPVALGLDALRFVVYYTVIALYYSIKWLLMQLINWLLELAKSLINQAFSTVSNKFIGTLLFFGALFLAYLFFFDSTLWRDAKELIIKLFE